MSYIFGILDFSGVNIKEGELTKLERSVNGENFVSHIELAVNYAIGYGHFPGRESNCAIYMYQHLVLLADLRIYNLEYLKTFFSFDNQYEAFAKAFLKWGTYCANSINGDFAVVVIDQKNNEVHLIRDHIGARPLAYCYMANRLIFHRTNMG
ncbi:MAG: hypothetical protein WCP85_00165 [Mariniphaga sp.]